MIKTHPFQPVYDKTSKVLILGTLPSIESVKQGFYYMHPQNRFWKMLSAIYHMDLYTASIEEKKEFLLKHSIALYDIIQSCEIQKSSDASIRNVSCTDLENILKESQIQLVLLNGKTAYEHFLKSYPQYKDIARCVPSTSSANARISLEELIELWKKYLFL